MTGPGDNSVAADELRSFVDRIEPPAQRLEYLLDRLRQCGGVDERTINRAWSLAARLVGVEYRYVHGPLQAAMFGDSRHALRLMRPGVMRFCGFVYRAVRADKPGREKIGFSANPDARARQLSSVYRIPVTIIAITPGTMLDEHAAHCDARERRIEGEWFRISND